MIEDSLPIVDGPLRKKDKTKMDSTTLSGT